MKTIAAREVPVASRSPYPIHSTSRGTITEPPPTPKTPLKRPAAVPIAASLNERPATVPATGRSAIMRAILVLVSPAATLVEALEPLRSDPSHAAVLLDIDGTLAPIVRHADDAHVPEATRTLLIEISKS